MIGRILFCVGLLGSPHCGDRLYETRTEASTAVAEALCTRAQECGTLDKRDVDDCVGHLVRATCLDIDCDREPVVSDLAIEDCIDALDDVSCSAQTLPWACGSML